jgi:hypothetical protein
MLWIILDWAIHNIKDFNISYIHNLSTISKEHGRSAQQCRLGSIIGGKDWSFLFAAEYEQLKSRGIRGQVVKVVDFKPLSPHRCGFESWQGLKDSFMWGSYPTNLRNVGGSTQVPVHAWNNARKGTWGLPPPVKLERRQMNYTVSVWRKTQNNQSVEILLKCWMGFVHFPI